MLHNIEVWDKAYKRGYKDILLLILKNGRNKHLFFQRLFKYDYWLKSSVAFQPVGEERKHTRVPVHVTVRLPIRPMPAMFLVQDLPNPQLVLTSSPCILE